MRRAYRRPVTEADLRRPARALSRRAARTAASTPASRWRCRAVLVSPKFLFRVEPDPAGVAPEHAVSRQRSRAGVAAVVLPLEQHPGRRTARRGDRRQAARAGGARTAGAAHAGRPAVARARRPTSPRSGCTCAISRRSRRTCACSRISTTTCGRPSAQETELFFESVLREDRSVLDLLRAELHVRQRAAGQALRHPARLRQSVPPRRARQGQRARRTAAPGQHPDGHLVRHADLAGDSRQVDSRQPARRAAATAAARRAGAEGQHGGRQPLRARAAGRAPRATRPAPAATT